MLKKYIVWVEVILLAIALLAAYMFGCHVTGQAARADKNTAVIAQKDADLIEQRRQIKQTQDNAALAQAEAVANATAHQKTTIEYRTITQQVTKYVATHPDVAACTLDDDGLRIWREANAGRSSTAGSSQP
ncbi:MAG TPA: hypothetical protein VGV14_02925 [Rhodanobacter sp.]|nr:hypothetical protein [Rhodanobacter sp.]